MQVRFLVGCIFLFLSLSIHAQIIVEKTNGGERQISQLSFNLGLCFANSNGLITSAGSPALRLGVSHYFSKRWGIEYSLSGASHAFYADHGFTNSTYSSNERWFHSEVQINPSFSIVTRKKWALDLYQGFGICYMHKPSYTEYNSYYSKTLTYQDNHSLSGLMTLGIKSRVELSPQWGLQFNANYSVDFFNYNLTKTSSPQVFPFSNLTVGVLYNWE